MTVLRRWWHPARAQDDWAAPALPAGCAECPRRAELPTNWPEGPLPLHADRTDRRSLLRACAGGVILAVVPSGACANGDIGGGADVGKDDDPAGGEAGTSREASVGVGDTGRVGEADATVQMGEAGPASEVDANAQPGQTGRAGEAGADAQRGQTGQAGEAGANAEPGDANAQQRDAESAPPDAACSSTCSTGATAMNVSFETYPALAQVGGSALVQFTGYSDPVCGSDVLIVLQPTAGKFLAFSAGCTHACCAISYEASASRFYCGCHGSAFDLTGKVIAGPAKRALTALTVCSDACGVHVMA